MLVGGRLKDIAARKADLVRAANLERTALRLEARGLKESVLTLGRVSGWLQTAMGLGKLLAGLRRSRTS